MTTSIETANARRPTAPVRPLTLGLGLRLVAGADELPCVWNCVAYEGEWQGHPAGAFRFSRQTFEQIVANFRADPRCARRGAAPPPSEASAEQIASGTYDVIQWDFHHAAEMPAADVAAAGAPAQGWVLDLAIGEYEGKCALMALTRWLEPARTYIRTERYKYCSVSVWLNAIDPASGKDVGAVLTSIAITNNPFLQGLPPLRATREGHHESPAGSTGHAQERQMDQSASGAKSGAHDGPAAGAGGPNLRTTLARTIATQRKCSVDDVNDGHILAAVNDYAKIQGELDELMAELGAKTFAEGLAKIAAAKNLEQKLRQALEGQSAAESAMQGMEEEMMEEDVGLALASLNCTDERVKKALKAERGKSPDSILAFRKTYEIDALKKAAREELVKTAQKVVASRSQEPPPAHLTASIATIRQTPPAAPQTTEEVTLTMGPDGALRLATPRSREQAPGARDGVTLASLRKDYPHEPNDFLRKVAFVKATHARNNPTAPSLTHDQACEHAAEMRLAG